MAFPLHFHWDLIEYIMFWQLLTPVGVLMYMEVKDL